MKINIHTTIYATLSISTLLLAGCGPSFAKIDGTLDSNGGLLRAWSAKPLICSKDDGDPNKLLRLSFDLPQGFSPSKPGNRNAPEDISFAKNGDDVMGSLRMFGEVKESDHDFNTIEPTNGFVLDSSNCKTIHLDRQEQMAPFGFTQKPIKGRLVLDCTVKGSHVKADIKFKNCTF